ncbi:putative lysine-specific demethylase JMJ16 isoform X1 [Mangifera indica]|uniref:putative lysine-specific demethylase JMJ16 isoform X1 n=1 Tax=Mangifera indica TaxID=29780 RepID=UPI001CFBF875|nr:putative lysine-specific demethylase JMJ16 isoform X1 [Mangifera indica]XP_044477888.1 putative lysine-specific demethylase JMJ16 isoform X1 [Mangifera indica]XP_044477899.1 putative lysine-specific demethylase JMJ16 isoform X1 [Mangifera indica]
MGTELVRISVKEENDEVPPGFESYAVFTLKRVQDTEKHDSDIKSSCSASASASESQQIQVETDVGDSDGVKTRSLRRRPWINYGQFGHSSDDESDYRKLGQNFTVKPRLPKGVIRGCPGCSDCQKITARWRPEGARRPVLEDAPVFYPTAEEFEDTLKYIASIRPKAEPYGICRIVPPPSWKPPCPLKEKHKWESSTFVTRVQRVDKLQNRHSMRKISKFQNHTRRKRRRCTKMAMDYGTDSGNFPGSGFGGCFEDERFGFEPGPEFTLNKFQKYADFFKAQYFSRNRNDIQNMGVNTTTDQEHWEPSVENIEGEYWRIVEKATEEIEVLYGADLETGVFGSGFPKLSIQVGSSSDDRYIKSGWNLNNFPRLPGSVLTYESGDISGVLVPWLYIGMCFSSFCWHVEDHHLYSLNYMHWGAPKMWYGVPGNSAVKLEETMKKHLPDLFEEQPDLLHKLVTQLSPSILKSEGVPVYRCVQNAGEFVLTFPRAYHSGFNCGFNCAEAVNVAPVDWLPHGQIAIELYREQGRKTSISHDKLLLGAAREAVRAHWELNLLKKNNLDNLRWKDLCGKDGILARALKTRVEMEHVGREYFCNSSLAMKMDSNFDATSERECSVCLFDLHLSAVGCHCSSDKYACLNHAKNFCSCDWSAKFFLFRYDISELNILVEALEGKLSAVYRWARLDLGLALSSYFSRDNMQVDNLYHSNDGKVQKELKSQLSEAGIFGLMSFQQNNNPSEASLPMKDMKTSPTSDGTSYGIERKNSNLKLKTEESIHLASSLGHPACQFSPEDMSNNAEQADQKSLLDKSLVLGSTTVILLSDDEDDEPKEAVSKRSTGSSVKNVELSGRLASSEDKASTCNHDKDPVLFASITDAALMSQKDLCSVSDVQRLNYSSSTMLKKDEHHPDGGKLLGSNPPEFSCPVGSTHEESGRILSGSTISGETSCPNVQNAASNLQHLPPCDNGKSNNEDSHENLGTTSSSNLVSSERTNSGNPSCSQNSLDRCFRQKGPRIAKVVRRINCNVEALEYGVVLPGKFWCNSQAIFPKGFRSRVRYISILDPTNMCYYVSEILDVERDRPLFMVSLEQSLSEVFVHVSAARCWEMVRDRVNQEIAKQHKLGRSNLPPLQPPGSLDGFEMFGFSSPAIVQAIEAMDHNRVCLEYWDSRPYSRAQMQIQQPSQNSSNLSRASGEQNNRDSSGSHLLPVGADTILRGLFKKATNAELHSLYSILNDNRPEADRFLLTRLLIEEIHNRPR